jgi:signal transduction histidine kinase
MLDSLYDGGYHQEGLAETDVLRASKNRFHQQVGQFYAFRILLRTRAYDKELVQEITALRAALSPTADSLTAYMVGRLFEFEAFYYHLENEPERAPGLFDKGAQQLAEVKSFQALCNLYYLAGAISSRSWFHDRAIDYYLSGIALQERLDYPDTSLWLSFLSGIASVYIRMEQPVIARPFLSKALLIADHYTDVPRRADILTNLGNLEATQEESEQALFYYFQALDYFSQLQDKAKVALVNGNIGGVYLNNLGDYEKGLTYLSLAFLMQQELGNEAAMNACHIDLAKAYSLLNDVKTSDSLARIAHQWALEKRKFNEIVESAKVFVSNALEQKDYATAFRYQLLISIYRDSIGRVQTNERIEAHDRLRRMDYWLYADQESKTSDTNWEVPKGFIWLVWGFAIIFFCLFLIVFVYRSTKVFIAFFRPKFRHPSENIVQGQLFERGRIAINLHDNLGNLMALLRNYVYRLYRHDPEIQEIVKQAASESRAISHNLSADGARLLYMTERLAELSDYWNQKKDLLIEVDTRFFNEIVALEQKIIVFRMIQEMVSNSFKKGKSDYVLLEVRNDEPQLLIFRLTDNGMGFSNRYTPKGLGLLGLETRVNQMFGFFHVFVPRIGTSVEIRLPILS